MRLKIGNNHIVVIANDPAFNVVFDKTFLLRNLRSTCNGMINEFLMLTLLSLDPDIKIAREAEYASTQNIKVLAFSFPLAANKHHTGHEHLLLDERNAAVIAGIVAAFKRIVLSGSSLSKGENA